MNPFPQNPQPIRTTCCVVGGGPAGMMLGFLLARAGVDVVVLEKHADFLRDFRGDTVHPSTLELMHELGLLEEFLRLPHQELASTEVTVRRPRLCRSPDFSHLPTRCKFIALMPQWDFLNFLADTREALPGLPSEDEARKSPTSSRRAAASSECERSPEQGRLEVRADLVFGTDGRHSTVRERAGWRSRTSASHRRPLVSALQGARRARASPSAGSNGKILSRSTAGTTASAASSSQGHFDAIQRAGIGGVPRRHRERRALPGGTVERAHGLGRGQAADRAGRTASATGTARACSASATRRTPCRPSAASASTSRSRTRSRRPTCSPPRSGRGRSPRTTSAASAAPGDAGPPHPGRPGFRPPPHVRPERRALPPSPGPRGS